MVVGGPGVGKTTVASALAQRCDLVRVELDELWWGPHWTSAGSSELRTRVSARIDHVDGWVADGNYLDEVSSMLWGSADVIVWLDLPRRTGFVHPFTALIGQTDLVASQPEEDLQNIQHRPIVRVGDTVRRPSGWWTPAVQALLQHLRDVGFTYAPRPGGNDSEGREVLSYVAGESGATGWYKIHSEQGLRRFATLLRECHEAVEDFQPGPDLEWAVQPFDPHELVCHNDFGPGNLVYDGDEPVGIIDWDFAAPGPRRNDIAYALEYAVPFRDDATALSWHHFANA